MKWVRRWGWCRRWRARRLWDVVSSPARLGRKQLGGGMIVFVATGGPTHTVALAEGGVLWVWGNGAWGQLGLGDRDNRLVPTRLGAGDVFAV